MEGDIKRLLADYKELETNTFWHYFMGEIIKRRSDILEELGNGQRLTLEEMKHKQGQSVAYKNISPLAENLAKMLKDKLGKSS